MPVQGNKSPPRGGAKPLARRPAGFRPEKRSPPDTLLPPAPGAHATAAAARHEAAKRAADPYRGTGHRDDTGRSRPASSARAPPALASTRSRRGTLRLGPVTAP